MLTVLVVAIGFAGAVAAEDRKPEAGGADGENIQLRIVGEKAEVGGVVFRLGESSNFWLGVALEQEDGRLEVEQVLPESPAAKAGIKEDDVLLASGDTALKEVGDLQKLVQSSDGKPLKLKILRDGKEIVVEVKPERREGVQAIVIGEGDEAGKGDKEELRKRLEELMKQARKQAETASKRQAGGWQLLRAPNVVSNAPFPANLEVTIKKKGNKPLRIKVRQDAQTWSVGEKELDKLPESIRGHVARMLPGRAPAPMWMPVAPRPGAPLNPAPPKQLRLNPAPVNPAPAQRLPANPAPANQGGFGILAPGQPLPGASVARLKLQTNDGELQKEIQQLKHELHELREQVEALRKQ
jgi:hypothetical protein